MAALYQTSFPKPRAPARLTAEENKMKKLTAVALSLLFMSFIGLAQKPTSSTIGQGSSVSAKKRGPVFRATKGQINQAQSILKDRGFYAGDQTGKLDDATRAGLRRYQTAENIKVTGTLNRLTLERMGIQLTEKQKVM